MFDTSGPTLLKRPRIKNIFVGLRKNLSGVEASGIKIWEKATSYTALTDYEWNLNKQEKHITWLENFFSLKIKYNVAKNKHIPWPQSPNITANKKGNVMIVYTPGFASWYLATLQ